MKIEFEIAGLIPATPKELYEAWLDSEKHTNITGGKADITDVIGAPFQAWDGYIEGTNIELDHGMQYKQGWVDAYFTPMQEHFIE